MYMKEYIPNTHLSIYCIALFFICVYRFQSLEYFSLTNGKLYRFIPLYILKACLYFIHTGLYDILTAKSNVFFLSVDSIF